jgi:hypothetical protein
MNYINSTFVLEITELVFNPDFEVEFFEFHFFANNSEHFDFPQHLMICCRKICPAIQEIM